MPFPTTFTSAEGIQYDLEPDVAAQSAFNFTTKGYDDSINGPGFRYAQGGSVVEMFNAHTDQWEPSVFARSDTANYRVPVGIALENHWQIDGPLPGYDSGTGGFFSGLVETIKTGFQEGALILPATALTAGLLNPGTAELVGGATGAQGAVGGASLAFEAPTAATLTAEAAGGLALVGGAESSWAADLAASSPTPDALVGGASTYGAVGGASLAGAAGTSLAGAAGTGAAVLSGLGKAAGTLASLTGAASMGSSSLAGGGSSSQGALSSGFSAPRRDGVAGLLPTSGTPPTSGSTATMNWTAIAVVGGIALLVMMAMTKGK